MSATFTITNGRIGHIEQDGKVLRLAIYSNRRAGTNDDGSPRFESDRFPVVALGKNAQDWTGFQKGEKVDVSGDIRTYQGQLQFVAWSLEPSQPNADEAESAPESATEPATAAEPQAEEAAKPKRRGKKAEL